MKLQAIHKRQLLGRQSTKYLILVSRHEAERLEQEARGKLERQKIEDEASAEQARKNLLELQVQLSSLEATGQAKAEAQSKAEAMQIASKAEVERARLEAEALAIKTVRFSVFFVLILSTVLFHFFIFTS